MEYNETTGFATDAAHQNFVVIPIEIWTAQDLSWNERVLLAEIDRHTRHGRDCFVSNEYISKFLGVHVVNASKILSSLIKKGYVSKTRFDGRKRYITSNMLISFDVKEESRLSENAKADLAHMTKADLAKCANADLAQTLTIIVNENNSNELNSQYAPAREKLIDEILESRQWVESKIREGIAEENVRDLLNYTYDLLLSTTGEIPDKKSIIRYSHYKTRDFKEWLRVRDIKSKDIAERKNAFWKETLKYKDEYPKEMRDAFVLFYAMPSKTDDGLMRFEEPGFDVATRLRSWRLKDEQKNKGGFEP